MNRRHFLTALAGVGIARNSFGAQEQSTETPPLLRLPYLQNTQKDSTSILWASEFGGEGTVEYSADGKEFSIANPFVRGFRSSHRNMPAFMQYQVNLSGLAPDTDYTYRVLMDGVETGGGAFRTAGIGPFKFVVIGDSGQGTHAQRLISQRIAGDRPAFLLHAGDMAYFEGTQLESQWHHFDIYRDVMSAVPFFPCPGNHEYVTENARTYLSMHAVPVSRVPPIDHGRYYSFDWGNAHFVSLDSNKALLDAIRGQGEMLRWLEEDLRTSEQFLRVAMIHHPPYPGGPNQNDIEVHLVREHVVPILEKYGVQLVLSGHEHSYQRTENIRNGQIVPQNTGTTYVISGGAGSELYPTFPHPFHAAALSEHHYLKAEVNESSMSIRAIRPDGSELEEFILSPRPTLINNEDGQAPAVSLIPTVDEGSLVRILGQALASTSRFTLETPFPVEMGGTSVTIDGSPISLLHVSNAQIWGHIPQTIRPPFVLEVRNANGVTETIVRE